MCCTCLSDVYICISHQRVTTITHLTITTGEPLRFNSSNFQWEPGYTERMQLGWETLADSIPDLERANTKQRNTNPHNAAVSSRARSHMLLLWAHANNMHAGHRVQCQTPVTPGYLHQHMLSALHVKSVIYMPACLMPPPTFLTGMVVMCDNCVTHSFWRQPQRQRRKHGGYCCRCLHFVCSIFKALENVKKEYWGSNMKAKVATSYHRPLSYRLEFTSPTCHKTFCGGKLLSVPVRCYRQKRTHAFPRCTAQHRCIHLMRCA